MFILVLLVIAVLLVFCACHSEMHLCLTIKTIIYQALRTFKVRVVFDKAIPAWWRWAPAHVTCLVNSSCNRDHGPLVKLFLGEHALQIPMLQRYFTLCRTSIVTWLWTLNFNFALANFCCKILIKAILMKYTRAGS